MLATATPALDGLTASTPGVNSIYIIFFDPL